MTDLRDLLIHASASSWAVELYYHVDASRRRGGWCIEINDWSHYGTLDECLAAAAARLELPSDGRDFGPKGVCDG